MTTSRRLVLLVGTTGFAASVLVAVVAGRAYTGSSTPPTGWWGLVGDGWQRGATSVWGVLLWVGITGLSLSWLATLWLARRGAMDVRRGWTFAALWTTPLALGPPAVSKDVYAYSAQALVLRHGGDIYRDGPAYLSRVPGHDAIRALGAVDPRWRDSPSPYGPATALVQWLAGASGNPVVAIAVLRAVAVLAVVALAWLCVSLASDERRGTVLALVALNPVVLIHAVSGAHVEALMCALLVAALVAGRRQVWWAAIVLATLAGLVKAPALLAVPTVIAWHLLATRDRRRIAGDIAVAALTLFVVSVVVPDGWGWVRNLATPGKGDPTSSITGHLAALANGIAPVAKSAVTALGALAAMAVIAGLAATFRRRPPAESLGWALLAVAFLAPVTYPWYALWGMVCLLPTVRGRGLALLVGLSVAEAGFSIPGGSETITEPLVLAVLAASVAGIVVAWRRSSHEQVVASVGPQQVEVGRKELLGGGHQLEQ